VGIFVLLEKIDRKVFFIEKIFVLLIHNNTKLLFKPYQKMKKTFQYIIERHQEDPECLFMAFGFIILCTVAFFLLPYFIVYLG